MVLEIKGITKIYRGRHKSQIVANDNLTISIKEGEILGLLGHNGSGKTTLVNQIIGTSTPSSGDIILLGESVKNSPKRARSLCSVQPQSQLPLGFLTPSLAVSTMGKMRGGNKKDVSERMEMLFEALDIGKWANTQGIKLSGGIRRLTAFCMAVIKPGNLVILDEPTNDVDPTRRRYLWEVIRQLADDGTSVILVTHNVIEAEKAVDRVAILHKGQFIASGSLSEVKRRENNKRRIVINPLAGIGEQVVPEWAISAHRNGTGVTISIDEDAVSKTIEWAEFQMKHGIISDYLLSPTTLEDIYVNLTKEKDKVIDINRDSEKGVSL
ncbi:ABC transporter ATP-binding protein [Oceanobacillus manasiensis]|uniref:ABC transporter ATP-binding protein n=1 Tax=Oceanobacillus manasiensis TaxID=586413 RepID=UPI0005AAC66E|nr:ABC transporter ATP-binding protein [Oceanobacillus manasiensis]